MTMPVEVQEPAIEELTVTEKPWIVIVWNDPVNLMNYVVYVFQKLFGYSRKKATKLMRQVHEEGGPSCPTARSRSVRPTSPGSTRTASGPRWNTRRSASRVMARWRRFRPRGDGTLTVSLADEELSLMRVLPEQLREVFEEDADDPARARLFPRAYLDPTAETEEAEWQALVGPSLLRERLDALELITVTLARAEHAGDWWQIDLTADEVHGVARCAQRHAAGAGHAPRRDRGGARARPRGSGGRPVRALPVAHVGAERPGGRAVVSEAHERAFRSMIAAYVAGDRDTMAAAIADGLVAYVTNAEGGGRRGARRVGVHGACARWRCHVLGDRHAGRCRCRPHRCWRWSRSAPSARAARCTTTRGSSPASTTTVASTSSGWSTRSRLQRRVLVVAILRIASCTPNVRSVVWWYASRVGLMTFLSGSHVDVREEGRGAVVGVVGRGARRGRSVRGGSLVG